VTAGKETSLRLRAGRSHVALNSHSAPTAAFVKNANWTNPGQACLAAIASTLEDPAALGTVDADAIATQLLGDSIYTNPVLLGFAWQKGWLPLGLASLLQAMELNAVAVEKNVAAFHWGRLAAHDPTALARALQPAQSVQWLQADIATPAALKDVVAKRVDFLSDYQNAAYAASYADLVEQVERAEEALHAGQRTLSVAVARNLFKLMAYKDEYEVARLHSAPQFRQRIAAMFEGNYHVNYHLAPPLFAKKNAQGQLQKQKMGPWVAHAFRILAPLKFLRGTAWDPFGYTHERKAERALVREYRAVVQAFLPQLSSSNYGEALAFATLPEGIRGFGHVKARHGAQVRPQWEAGAARWGVSLLATTTT
jgi:indolepyruvate ferredoxin oxidoreductase